MKREENGRKLIPPVAVSSFRVFATTTFTDCFRLYYYESSLDFEVFMFYQNGILGIFGCSMGFIFIIDHQISV
ncbi:MAG: hypothetical protein JJT76_09045 [Clostridiaceae bacterium]|nr:hypothetical protein [Clostridiaceae bacterium]